MADLEAVLSEYPERAEDLDRRSMIGRVYVTIGPLIDIALAQEARTEKLTAELQALERQEARTGLKTQIATLKRQVENSKKAHRKALQIVENERDLFERLRKDYDKARRQLEQAVKAGREELAARVVLDSLAQR